MRDMLSWFAAAYATVLVAELVGDRSVYSIGALTSRFPALPVLIGVIPAFAAKAFAGVLVGAFVGRLPERVVAAATAGAFLVSALAIWRDRPEPEEGLRATPARWSRVALTAFASVFFTEWADAGQLAVAALAARSTSAVSIWAGATLALATKGVVAITLGVGLRRYLPHVQLRRGAIAMCLLMSGLSLVSRG